jgi:hypothetical protein
MSDELERIEYALRRAASAIAATELAVFAVSADPLDEGLKPLIHIRQDNSDVPTRDRALTAFKQLIHPFIQQRNNGVIALPPLDKDGTTQFCLMVLATRGEIVYGAAVFIVRCRDLERARDALEIARRFL